MISLELPEVVLIYDDNGHVVDAEREDSAYTHKLIEMFMVEANEVLARLFEHGCSAAPPDAPRSDPETSTTCKAAMVAGFRIPKNPTREELQSLLNATRGTPASRAVHMAIVLRTMSKAEYSPAMIGHRLASEAYALHELPIRRYADPTVHQRSPSSLSPGATPLAARSPTANGRKLRDSEMMPRRVHPRADRTPRDHSRRKCRIGRAVASASSSCCSCLKSTSARVSQGHHGHQPKESSFRSTSISAEGFVKKEDLPGDVTRENLVPFWKVDPAGALVDQRSGRSYNMGDTVSVKVVAVDLPTRRMDLVVDAGDGRAVGRQSWLRRIPIWAAASRRAGAGFGDGALAALV